MAEMDNKLLLGIVVFISGVATMIFRYISKLKEKVQFKDVCKATHQGLNQTLEAKFEGLTKLMEQRFEDLGDLIKKNGNG
jgi:hypothetical protein